MAMPPAIVFPSHEASRTPETCSGIRYVPPKDITSRPGAMSWTARTARRLVISGMATANTTLPGVTADTRIGYRSAE